MIIMAIRGKEVLFIFLLIQNFYSSNGCSMQGVTNWNIPVGATILDTHRGVVIEREIADIESITSVSFWEGLNGGPYVSVAIVDSRFVITTNEAYEDYEEYETDNSMSVTVFFRCTSGSTTSIRAVVEVDDTNNNAPRFPPASELDYTIYTPLPPGSVITGCFDGITVRDIDLTTERIDFAIEENPYFEIEYDAAASNTPKEFVGILKTKDFIRSLPEPITLRIYATDVDRTNDPPRTTTADIIIRADAEFELPEEPVFTQTFYFADYLDNNQVTLTEPISLLNGFDEFVHFSLDGEFSSNFQVVPNGNEITLSVLTALPSNVLREKQIFLIVRAEREYTSGATATVIMRLPEVVPLEFEESFYEGTIENNILQVPNLILTQGYEGQEVSVDVFGEYGTYFSANIQGNVVTLLMQPLSNTIINENNVIAVEVAASTEFSTATTIVALEMIKDDIVTPVFNKAIYEGSYNTDTGLTLEQILFDQGYDEIVELSLEGEHRNLFTYSQVGLAVIISTTGIPPAMFNQNQILLTLQATKPRTVGASAAIIISLPAARQLAFEESTYRGTLQNNVLSLEPIILSAGYDGNVLFSITGEHENYFTSTPNQNQVTITLGAAIPENVILENHFIILTVEASGLNAVPTTTNVLIDIIKEDVTTPVFSQNIYKGVYPSTTGIVIQNINLVQGYDNDVIFDLQGDHAEYFAITNDGNNAEIYLTSVIPADIIYNEKVLVLTAIANKPLTVGANAAITISFSSELTERQVMRFEQNTYNAVLENNELRTDNIILSTGHQSDTEYLLTTDNYRQYFHIDNTDNEVWITLINDLPIYEIESPYIVLEIEARRERAISAFTSVVVYIVREEIEPLVFSKPYYQGNYNEVQESLTIEVISLMNGYDGSVLFDLEGDLSELFSISDTTANSLTVIPRAPLSVDVLENNNHIIFAILATKPDAISARAAISITIERATTVSRYLRFGQDYYTGYIEDGVLKLDSIALSGYSDDVLYNLNGDYADYFQVTEQQGIFTITLRRELPAQVIETYTSLIHTLVAETGDIRTHTTIIVELTRDRAENIMSFEEAYYVGSYSRDERLVFNTNIRLTEDLNVPVTYSLHGYHSEWFELDETEYGQSLLLISEIPEAVIENNNQLIFTITAQSPGYNSATATIVITIIKENNEELVLGFDRVFYVGTIEGTAITLDPITLIEGYTNGVQFSLQGDLATYFTATPQGGGVVTVTQSAAIPDALIPANRIIVLDIRASAPPALSAHATIVFEVIVDDDLPSGPQLNFDATYYTGVYTTPAGVSLNTPISLEQGYDQTVNFVLEGDHAQWFAPVQNGNYVTLTVTSTIPTGVLANNAQLVFVIAAQRSGSDTARATIVISLNDDYDEGSVLGFDRVFYVGTIEGTAITLDPITLIEGYTNGVQFSLQGDLATYFTATPQGGGVVTVTQSAAIPDALIPANRIIVLDIRASAPPALSAHATIVFEVIVDDDLPSGPQLNFDATYYTGVYTTPAGVSLNTPISLEQGYDQTVNFVLEGDHAQWFAPVQNGNYVTLTVTSTIPTGVLANNAQLVFVIAAQRSGSDTARATIVISLNDDYDEGSVLGFDRVFYVGTIEGTAITLDPITLIEGYTNGVQFSLQGDLATYFTATPQGGGVVTVTQSAAIPDALIPANRIIVLDIRASAPPALSAHATIVFEVIVDDDLPSGPQLNFDATYYTGVYTTPAGVSLNTPISLEQGYDQTVNFVLEGDHAQWFAPVQNGNYVTLTVTSTIPTGVLANNAQLVFVIAAQRSGSDTARATIVISLNDDYDEGSVLGFDRVFYVGTIEGTAITLDPITLIEGYTNGVQFSLQGDLATYFTATPQGGGVVTVTQSAAIPDALIPANRIIVLDIRASAPPALSAHATIVFEVIMDDDLPSGPQLNFDATYYTGVYTTPAGVSLNTPISLEQGYDQTVNFVLEGDHAQWFAPVQNGNYVTLTVTSTIPTGVLANNAQLVFVIAAQQSGSDTARATIVISLNDDYDEGSVLGFDRVFYVGTIEGTAITLDPITLIEGYTNGVQFSLQGDLATYFTATPQGGGVVTVTQSAAIPDALIPANRIIVLDIRASAPPALSAHATIVFEVIMDDDLPSGPQLNFDATYYTGVYTTPAGVSLNTPISLEQGYDQTVNFVLEGDHAQWFAPVQNGNYVTLTVTSTIPTGVLANNAQLVFVIAAQRSGSDTARATIVISLNDDYDEGSVLGFDRVFYVGTIEGTAITLDPITLIEGYTNGVQFSLQGDLATYFTATPQGGGVVTVTQSAAIPDALIPANRIIVLDIRASAPPALSAHATIVFEVIVDDDLPSGPQLNFDATYYTGVYTTPAGVSLNTPISLEQGYDQTVNFVLEGDHAQWFAPVQNGNYVTLTVTSTIPTGVLANNAQLVFVIAAQRSGSDTARATIVISLNDDYDEGSVLGFDRVFYVGTIEGTAITLDPITLIEGYTNGVQFSLQGDLATYFTATPQGGGVVTVTQSAAIPDALIPANRIIVLDIRASAPPALSAHATIVFEVIMDDDLPSGPQLNFDATYYTGVYTTPAGVSLNTPISLEQGYDQTVNFVLEGDHAQWFAPVQNGNYVTLTVTSTIPTGVLANNAQLVFVIAAQRSGSDTARATIVISLNDDYDEGSVLGFDRVFYVGTIEGTAITLDPITLIEGYTNGVQFSLQGDLATYFTATPQGGGVVTVTQSAAIPDALIPANRIIVLDIRASAPPALSAHATIVFEVIVDDDLPSGPQLNFDATYYTGVYTTPAGVSLNTPISLEQGYDQTVNFVLEGDHAQWFAPVQNGNYVTLTVTSTIPTGVLANNAQLVFVIAAQRSGSDTARATIVISLNDDYDEGSVLGFDRVFYVGTIEGTAITLDPITLIEGYTNGVQFSLQGDLATYFTATPQGGGVVTVTQSAAIPDALIPANRIIVLDIRASAPPALSAHATIVFEVIMDDDLPSGPQLNFDATYYTGVYTTPAGVSLNTPISLEQGYDQTVNFVLEGDHAQWFAPVQNGNYVTLTVTSTIPTGVLANNAQLVFVIAAQRSGSDTARATIVISLNDDYDEGSVLGFDRVFYVGTIEGTAITLDPITLIEGYTNGVQFSLQGDLATYFTATPQGGGVVTVTQSAAIPDALIPANRIIVLDIRASAPPALSAHATIVFEVIVDDDLPSGPQLNFDATYYTGVYTTPAGVSLNTPISLEQGYDQTVNFVLEGDHAQWFAPVQNGNYVTLTVTSTIPTGVLANNAQLVFVIAAQRSGSDTARATIVISLNDDYDEGSVLGFDRVFYVGTIEGTAITLDPITLIEGYTNGVQFSLQGDLATYFTATPQGGGVVTVTQSAAIPDALIPANRIIVLDIRASAPPALSAHATIVFEVIVDDDLPSGPQLNFDATYYTGVYTTPAGVSLNTPISLEQGYDETVNFVLEGDHAQWFAPVQNGNYVTLTVTSTIPTGVLANNAQLVFVIAAQRSGSDTARATIVISLNDDYDEGSVLGFDRVFYVGTIEGTAITLDPITLIESYTNGVQFSLQGDLATYFTATPQGGGVVTVTQSAAIPDALIPANRIIVLDIRASAPPALSAHATIVFEVIMDDDLPSGPQLNFDATYYTGVYTTPAGVSLNTPISLEQGYDQTVNFVLEGDHAQWFAPVQNGNYVTLTVTSTIPTGVLANNAQLVFVIAAQRSGSDTARATIVISLNDDYDEGSVLGFDRVFYVGTIEGTAITLDPITLIEGYTNGVQFSLQGDLATYFTATPQGGGVVTVTQSAAIPDAVIPANRIIVLDIRASAPPALSAHATIVFEVIMDDDLPSGPQLNFDATYYTGVYTTPAGVSLNTPISLEQGYDQTVNFVLEGDHAQWFAPVQNGNYVTLTVTSTIPTGVLANNAQLVFVIAAQRSESDTARATIVISLNDDYDEGSVLGFDRVFYVGTIEGTAITLDPITLIEGYTNGVQFSLQGDLATYFTATPQGGGVVTVTQSAAIPDALIPANRIIVLDIRASAPPALSAHATIVFEVIVDDDLPSVPQLSFDATYYTGVYTTPAGVSLNTPISLEQGYDQTVNFVLEGDHAQWFAPVQNGNYVTLTVTSTIPTGVLANNAQLVFVIAAQRSGSDTARATIVILLTNDLQNEDDVLFDKLVYEGIVQLGVVQHESISLINYSGTSVDLHGDYSTLFEASLTDGVVAVQASGSLNLPDDVTQVVLELHAANARAVLLLQTSQTDTILPSVTFSSPSYVLSVEIVQTGLVGRVLASADNGEAVIYSLAVDNAHLQTRISINSDGELFLSAPASNGVYSFQVIATTVITRAEGMAVVHLTVAAVTVCGDDDDIVVPPLIILDRDEEEPHRNLVTLDTIQGQACYFTLSNRWPHEQDWVYVDESGLHVRSIDREHESIAFMALSQVQVELILHCENDSPTRSKRSLKTDWLGPYDYGSNTWILTESIPYNSRRSLVNLVVNDINDNAPIFVGKESEPIIVGYPTRELEERILPRSLAELQATDADIGENAALMYWSSEEVLAVAPTTGFVHLKTGAQVENNQRLTVSATDQRGQGLTGNIQLMVKLLDISNIVVVTVRDAFLDDENNILAQLSQAVGYEIKVLRSVVISDELEQVATNVSRKKRDLDTSQASLMLYIYGLSQNEPVLVERLTEDITNTAATVNVVYTISLEEHLELDTSSSNIGFMVATIVLSVLLFIIIVAIAVWFFLRWRQNKNYDEFTDENSLASRKESVEQLPKPELAKPRLNIEDLKRSEKRLQDMLSTPIETVTVEAMAPRNEVPIEAIIDLSPTETHPPIVIQSIDKLKDSDDIEEDEFGEISGTRRKSVVTFNENVEKIIHVEDNDDDTETVSSENSYEIYKL